MGWNLTSWVAGASRAVGLRREWAWPQSADARTGLGLSGGEASLPGTEASSVFSRAAVRARDALSPADRKAVAVAYDEMGRDGAVLDKALASGAHVAAVAALAGAWETLDEHERDFVRDPLHGGRPGPVSIVGTAACQVDQTTCGAASLAMMTMVGDPFVALWVVTGRSVGDYLPLEALMTQLTSRAIRTVEERWKSLQYAMHRDVRQWGLLLFPWPRALGTPPWRIRHVVRFVGLRFVSRLIDDRSAQEVRGFIAHASAAARDGIPVPLFVGTDSSAGLAGVVPRHVVLVVARRGEGFAVYEPGAGAVVEVSDAALAEGARSGARLAALGHWSRIAWAILPRQRTLEA